MPDDGVVVHLALAGSFEAACGGLGARSLDAGEVSCRVCVGLLPRRVCSGCGRKLPEDGW